MTDVLHITESDDLTEEQDILKVGHWSVHCLEVGTEM